jgi:selenoprotein B, glycine/betaine/sarcosine/D-proline reductase family
MIKVVHFINQFFAGIGSEEAADTPIGFLEAPKGPGVILEKAMQGKGTIVGTLYAGDNFANEKQDLFLEEAVKYIKKMQPDVIVAGPAFNSGRYGLACVNLLKAVKAQLGIPGVTGLGPDNPGNEYNKFCWIIPVGTSSAAMGKAIVPLASLSMKLGGKEELASAAVEGYLPQGIRKNVFLGINAAVRAVDMALARVNNRPWTTELRRVEFDPVAPPHPIQNMAKARIALVTEAGLVPTGNPDHMETWNATKWLRYELPQATLKPGKYEIRHGGHITTWVHEDPNRNVPLDAMRSLEKEGTILEVFKEYLVTCGNMTAIDTMKRLGHEMGEYLKRNEVQGVILTAT